MALDPHAGRPAGCPPGRTSLVEDRASDSRRPEPIAIIGIGCRFPGGVDGPRAFWQLLLDEVDAIADIPPQRFDVDAYYDPAPATPGKIITRRGGFLDRIDQFDAGFFGIAPREAIAMDPQQRLLLEVAWEALEDAGVPTHRLSGGRAGVFVGMWTSEYEERLYRTPTDIDLYRTTGAGRYSAAGRLSYQLDLRGPSLTVDTACSSALVAVHLACESLRRGESELALAGGVNLILEPHITIGYSRSGMLAPDGRCKFGDARANGYVRSEGAGVLVLTTLARALTHRDPIYALIRGSSVNNDGRSSGVLVRPAQAGLEAMLCSAYAQAGIAPGAVQYVEAHGTGTPVGDLVELQALGTVLAEGRPAGQRCAVGSVKTNIGHTEAAAGAAGLIKAALSLEQRTIPASLHFRDPNPAVAWHELPLTVPRQRQPWPAPAGSALAGVSSFGVTGTNAHVILQEVPCSSGLDVPPGQEEPERPHLFTLSAHTSEALLALAEKHLTALCSPTAEPPSLRDLCYTAGARRTHHEHRLALVARGHAELARRLAAFHAGEADGLRATGRNAPGPRPRLAFVYSGQGSQWIGMGRQLFAREPVFRAAIERCEQSFAGLTDWSLVEQLHAEAADAQLDQIDVIQPTLFAVQVALTDQWRAWGITPDVVVGHSMGEVSAAWAAGALSLEDAARVICRRSQLMARTSGRGAMAVVELTFDAAREALAGYEDRLSIAASNSRRSTVLSGDPGALEEVLARLQARDVFCRRVKVDVASHSPQMDPLLDDLGAALARLEPRAACRPIYSTTLGRIANGQELDAAYWQRNLRQPVHFGAAVEWLCAQTQTIFVEVSPHPVLLPAVQQALDDAGRGGAALASLQRDEDEQAVLLSALGSLYTVGCLPDWTGLYPEGARCVRLPTYPWQRERFWIDRPSERAAPLAGAPTHPLLGQSLARADRPGDHVWQRELHPRADAHLFEHRVHGATVLPASVYLALALAAAEEAFGPAPRALGGIEFRQALFLSHDAPATVQTVLAPTGDSQATFGVYSRTGEDRWTCHATGTVTVTPDRPADEERAADTDRFRTDGDAPLPSDALYTGLEARGIAFGPRLRPVARYWRAADRALAELSPAADPQGWARQLDACFQLSAALSAAGDQDAVALPATIEAVRVYAPAPAAAWAEARRGRPSGDPASPAACHDLALWDAEGRPVVAVDGLRLQRLDQSAARPTDECLYELRWEPVERVPLPSPRLDGTWLVFADRMGVGAALAGRLRAAGARCRLVCPTLGDIEAGPETYGLDPARPGDLERLFRDAAGPGEPPLQSVVHLWGLDAIADEGPRSLEWGQQGAASVVGAIQAAARAAGSAPRFWLVTQGAQRPTTNATASGFAQASIWGIGRVLAEEHPELWGGLIDLDPGLPAEAAAEQLLADLTSAPEEDQIALYGGQRYAARLVPRPLAADDSRPFRPRPDASYLVTGGLGGVGLLVARWLAEQGARRLILLGRSALPPRGEWLAADPASRVGRRIAAIRAIERLGATVHLAAVDVADESRLAAWLEGWRHEAQPPIRGVIHAAATVEDRLLVQLDPAGWQATLRPKALGAWHLHRLLDDLDFFVLFSSIGSLIGLPGQASYAAANAFLDGLAHYRRARGQVALSLNWGPWQEVGLAATAGGRQATERLLERSVGTLSLGQATASLARLLGAREGLLPPAQLAVVPVDRRAAPAGPSVRRPSRLLAALAREAVEAGGASPADSGAGKHVDSLPAVLRALEPAQRQARLQAHVREAVAEVVKLPPTRVEPTRPLGALGIDSLMAQELRRRLERSLGVELSATLVWNYPTVVEMTKHLSGKLGMSLPDATGAGDESAAHEAAGDRPSATDGAGALRAAIEALSDDEALEQLLPHGFAPQSASASGRAGRSGS